MDQAATTTLVLGIGNPLLGDEGVGVHAIRRLCDDVPEERRAALGLAFLDGGTIGYALSGPIGDADRLIIVDATDLEAEPGTVRVFADAELDRFLGERQAVAVHEVALLDLLAVTLLEGRLPARRALIAIQPGHIGWGEAPTDEVAAAIPRACLMALDLAEKWGRRDAA